MTFVPRSSSSPERTRAIAAASEKIRAIYKGWTRATSVADRRRDWDTLFHADVIPVTVTPVAGFVPGDATAVWIAPADARPDRVLYYLHGGGFTLGSHRSHHDLMARLAVAGRCRVFALDYRLAPEALFPAAVDDAAAAYRWLLDSGLAPRSIVVGGDSAGGGLVLTTMLAAKEQGLPQPAAGVLLSPFTDQTLERGSYASRESQDPFNSKSSLRFIVRNYLGTASPSDPRASPIFGDLQGLPPLLVQVGDHEVILDDAVDVAKRASEQGVDVTLEVHEDMSHVFQQFAADIPDAAEAIVRIGNFLERIWS